VQDLTIPKSENAKKRTRIFKKSYYDKLNLWIAWAQMAMSRSGEGDDVILVGYEYKRNYTTATLDPTESERKLFIAKVTL